MTDAAAPRKKKLPFKPTALRRNAAPSTPKKDDADDKNDDLGLFNRRKEMERVLAADREREAAKRRKQEERRRSLEAAAAAAARKPLTDDEGEDDKKDEKSPAEAEAPDTTAPPSAQPDHDESFATAREEPEASEIVTPPPSKRTRTDSPSSSAKRRRTPASQVAGSPSTRTRSSARKAENIIALDSEDDDEKDDSIQIVEPERPSPDNDDDPFADEEEEDEFAEYIRKAEAEKRKLGGPSAHTGGSSSRDTSAKGTKVDLFVQSAIPGSTHCLMKVFLESPLVLVRNAWVEAQRRHEVDIGVTDPADLVLTWRRSRVYNYSTLHSLGIRPMGDGIVVTTAAAGGAGDGTSGLSSAHPARVHMEVWTPDMFKQWEEERERQRRREEDEEQDDDEDEAGGRDAQEEEQEQAKFKVVLKARDLDDLKLTVRPETTAGTLVKAFRSARGLGAEAAVSLWFDGDMLEEEGTMDEAEIDDMDTIEVHVR